MAKGTPNKHLLSMVQDHNVRPEDRADILIYVVNEKGIDTKSDITQLLREADEGRVLKAKAQDEEAAVLMREWLVGNLDFQDQSFAIVTNGGGHMYVRCDKNQLEGLLPGDAVLINPKTQQVVGADGAIPPTGEVVTIDTIPDPHHVVIKHHEQEVKARVVQRLCDSGHTLKPGDKVVFNPTNHFVLELIKSENTGEELLTPVNDLPKITRADLGSPHPIVDIILDRLWLAVEQPDWTEKMGLRKRTSYLLVGPTGTGKTMSLKVVAAEFARFAESCTGQLVSRLVMCDASSFYSSLFGETENRINSWFRKIEKLASQPVIGPNGERIFLPLLIVMEEAEALFRHRGEMGGSSHLFDRPLAMILQRLDALTDSLNVPIIFCATTNRPDLMDTASMRRLGINQVTFGTLTASQAVSVLGKKIPATMPLRLANGKSTPEARQTVINQIISYLFGNEPAQELAEVLMRHNEQRFITRRELVTPAVIEMAISKAIDESVRQSIKAKTLLGLDAGDVIAALQEQFVHLAKTLRPYNVREHCPEWFTEESIHVDQVRPLVRQQRRHRSFTLQPLPATA